MTSRGDGDRDELCVVLEVVGRELQGAAVPPNRDTRNRRVSLALGARVLEGHAVLADGYFDDAPRSLETIGGVLLEGGASTAASTTLGTRRSAGDARRSFSPSARAARLTSRASSQIDCQFRLAVSFLDEEAAARPSRIDDSFRASAVQRAAASRSVVVASRLSSQRNRFAFVLFCEVGVRTLKLRGGVSESSTVLTDAGQDESWLAAMFFGVVLVRGGPPGHCSQDEVVHL